MINIKRLNKVLNKFIKKEFWSEGYAYIDNVNISYTFDKPYYTLTILCGNGNDKPHNRDYNITIDLYSNKSYNFIKGYLCHVLFEKENNEYGYKKENC